MKHIVAKMRYRLRNRIAEWLWDVMDMREALDEVERDIRNDIPGNHDYATPDDINDLQNRIDKLERSLDAIN